MKINKINRSRDAPEIRNTANEQIICNIFNQQLNASRVYEKEQFTASLMCKQEINGVQ